MYNQKSKYIVFLIEANDDECKLKSSDFGKIEIHDNIPRKIEWISLKNFLTSDVIKCKLNFRLKNKNLFDKLLVIKKLNVYNTMLLTPETQSSLSNEKDAKPKKIIKKSIKK